LPMAGSRPLQRFMELVQFGVASHKASQPKGGGDLEASPHFAGPRVSADSRKRRSLDRPPQRPRRSSDWSFLKPSCTMPRWSAHGAPGERCGGRAGEPKRWGQEMDLRIAPPFLTSRPLQQLAVLRRPPTASIPSESRNLRFL
jgi:hypothetical protein